MEDIQVGEYVRTKNGDIDRLEKIHKHDGFKCQLYEFSRRILEKEELKEYITKHSFNIIDLIEVGDYVNGYKVRGKTNEKVVVDYYCYSQELAGGNWLTFYKDNIISIITKEQFASMEYKLEE